MDDATHIKQTFAQRLRGLREAAGLTQQELGEMLGGYSRGSISYYEKAERVPDIVFLDAVCTFFDVSVNFLLGYCENKKAGNEDIGFRFGLSDKAIDILDNMDMFEYQDFISAIVEHKLFPRLFECMELYNRSAPLEEKTVKHSFWDEYEFRHFQLTRMVMTILDDLRNDCIFCGRTVTVLDDVDPEKRRQFYKAMLEQSNANTTRIIEEYEAERKEQIKKSNKQMREMYERWEEKEQVGRNARSAAQRYVETVNSSGEK